MALDSNGRVLLVCSEADLCAAVERGLAEAGFEVVSASRPDEASRTSSSEDFDLVIADLDPWPEEGVRLVEALRRYASPPEILVISDSPSSALVAKAIKQGAFNCLGKPASPGLAVELSARAVRKRKVELENRALRRIASQPPESGALISESPAMKKMVERLGQVANSSASILILGETGAGKGLVARTIHDVSQRRDQAFMHVNCAALQESLLESELFGHEKGAFTGAVGAKLGLFEVAHEGTLFLDEIGEMSPAVQAKLLQVLDAGELRRLGGTRIRKVDSRIVAATKRDLKKDVRELRFREDLYFRLNVVSVLVPPLRERREDIPLLVEHFLRQFRAPGQPPMEISRRALKVLIEYHWPGNVRELANVVENLSLLTPSHRVLPEHLPAHLRPHTDYESMAIEVPLPLAEMERLHILRVLDYTAGKKAPAARLLQVDVKTLRSKIKNYKIDY